MIFTEGQCDYEWTVSFAMKLPGNDENQAEDIKPEPFRKRRPHLPRREPLCHVNRGGKGRKMIALEGEGQKRGGGGDSRKAKEKGWKMCQRNIYREGKWNLPGMKAEGRHIENRETERQGQGKETSVSVRLTVRG